MFGLSILQLVLGGVAIASVGGGLWATANHFENKGEARIEQKYAPMTALCPDERKLFGGTKKASPEECAKQMKLGAEALEVNTGLKADIDRYQVQANECGRRVLRLQSQGERAAAAAAQRKPADDKALSQIGVEKQELIDSLPQIDALGLLPEPKTCEQKLARAEQRIARRDALWAKVAKEQVRDFPPSSTPPKSSDVMIRGPK